MARSIDEVMEDMEEKRERNPGPVKQFLNKMKSQGIADAKAALLSTARSYADEVDAAATAAGLEGEEKDLAVASALADVTEAVQDSLVEGAVQGRQATDVLVMNSVKESSKSATLGNDAAFADRAPAAPAAPSYGPSAGFGPAPFVPDANGVVNMQRQQAMAYANGDAVKTLAYSPDQVSAMREEDAVRAASLGMMSPEDMARRGIDPAAIQRDQAMRFGMAPTFSSVPAPAGAKAKVLPEYHAAFEAMGDRGAIVTSAEDMAFFGGEAPSATEAVQQAERTGTAQKMASDIARTLVGAAAPGVQRGNELDGLLATIQENSKQAQADSGYGFGKR